jgi:hypothetical protein
MGYAEADAAREWRGALQRALEVILFGWIVLVGRRLTDRTGPAS